MRLFWGFYKHYERAFGNKIFISIPFYIFLECLFGNRNREELLLRPPCDVYLEFPLSFFFLFNISIWKKRCSFFFQPKRSWRAAGEERRRRRRRGGSEQHEKRIAYWIRFSLSFSANNALQNGYYWMYNIQEVFAMFYITSLIPWLNDSFKKRAICIRVFSEWLVAFMDFIAK